MSVDMIKEQITQLNQRVVKLYKQGQYEQAVAISIETCDVARQRLGEKHPAFATSLNNLAMLYLSRGDYAQAEPLLRQASEIWRTNLGEAHPNVATSLNNLAELYREMGNYPQALPLYEQALTIRRKTLGETHPDVATSLHNLAELYRAMGNYAQAEPRYRQALEIWREALGETHPLIATGLSNLALLYKAQGNYIQAEPLYWQAIDIWQKALGEKHPHLATGLNNLAELYRETGDYVQAESLHRQALAIRHMALGERHPHVAISLNNLALLYYEMGNYAQAERFYQQALVIRRAVLGEKHPHVADSLNNLALLHYAMGDHIQAESLCQEAYAILHKALGGVHPNVATSLNNLAALYETMGKYDQAEPLFRQALAIRRTTLGETHPDVAISLNNLADLHRMMGDHTTAKQLYQQALSIQRLALGEFHPDVAISLNNLAALHALMGEYAQAEPLYRQALEIQHRAQGETHPDVAMSLHNLAGLYVATSRKGEALTTMEQASAIDDLTIGQISSIASERQRLTYLMVLQKFLDSFLSLVSLHLSHSREAVEVGLELVLRRKAIGAEALAVQREAILGGRYPTLVPKLHELALLRAQIAQKTLAGPGSEALEVHQQLLAEWNKHKERLETELAQEIPEMNLTQKLQTADRQEVSNALPKGAALIEFVRFNVFDFQAVPARGEGQWKSTRYVAFVLLAQKPEKVYLIDLGEADPIDQLVTELRAAITGEAEIKEHRQPSQVSPSRGEKRPKQRYMKRGQILPLSETYKEKGTALRRVIFDPILSVLDGRRHLFFAPEGDLTRLPFEVLPTDDGHYLIDKYHMSYLSTGRDILRFKALSSGQPTPPLVVADPDFDLSSGSRTASRETAQLHGRRSRDLSRSSLDFARLPGTRKEGQQIAALLGVQPLLERLALEASIKAYRSPRILHIATHGFFLPDQQRDPNKDTLKEGMFLTGKNARSGRLDQFFEQRVENPLLRSGLALAGVNTWSRGGTLPSEAEDGILTAEDVSTLDLLHTELVVLSACETGLGEIHVGEGVFGLRRVFVLAGAKTLVMSLWKVPDQQTQELMIDFYQRILAGQPRADALREAQLALKAKYPHPYYWGAFICQGDPRPLSLQKSETALTSND